MPHRITPAYLAEQKRLHADPRGYGARGDKWAANVATIVDTIKAASVLDYGCGQGSLARALGIIRPRLRIAEYDPAIQGKDGDPMFADVVVITDVLEHVEEGCLPAVLAHLAKLTRRQLFAVVSTVPTEKRLSDGRQAHITLHPREWWIDLFAEHGFTVAHNLPVKKPGKEFAVILERKTT